MAAFAYDTNMASLMEDVVASASSSHELHRMHAFIIVLSLRVADDGSW